MLALSLLPLLYAITPVKCDTTRSTSDGSSESVALRDVSPNNYRTQEFYSEQRYLYDFQGLIYIWIVTTVFLVIEMLCGLVVILRYKAPLKPLVVLLSTIAVQMVAAIASFVIPFSAGGELTPSLVPVYAVVTLFSSWGYVLLYISLVVFLRHLEISLLRSTDTSTQRQRHAYAGVHIILALLLLAIGTANSALTIRTIASRLSISELRSIGTIQSRLDIVIQVVSMLMAIDVIASSIALSRLARIKGWNNRVCFLVSLARYSLLIKDSGHSADAIRCCAVICHSEPPHSRRLHCYVYTTARPCHLKP